MIQKFHSILLYGQNPIKNTAAAYEIAISKMIENSDFDESSIKEHVSNGTYPNFFLVKRSIDENEISIEKTREIIEFLMKKPVFSGQNVVLIENFDDMSKNAANAILKILEEPPAEASIILTTTRLFSIIPTVRSRCIKMHIPSDECKTQETAFEYVRSMLLLKNAEVSDEKLQKIIDFLEKGCKDGANFIKQNTDINFFEDAILLYCGYLSIVSRKKSNCLLFMKIQKIMNLSKRTYPDRFTLLFSMCQHIADGRN